MADRNLDIALRIKADLESARKQLDELNKSVKATGDNSKGSADKLGAVGKRIDEMEAEAAAANKTLGQTGKVLDTSSGKAKTFGRETAQLARNLKNGNFDGAASNIGKLGAASGVAAEGAGALAVGLGGTVAVLALFAVAAFKGYQEDQLLGRSIIATGNYAGVTTGQVRVMADAIGAVTGRSDNAREALQLLIASGQVTGDNLQRVAQAALDLSTITGQSIEKSVQAFTRMRDEPVAAVKALDDSLHFLTLAQYEHIKALRDQGDQEGAAAAAQQAASVAVRQRAAEVVASVGLMERGWNNLRSNVIATWNAMKDVGATKTAADDLAAVNKELDGYRQRVAAIRARRGDTAPITDADLVSAGEVALSRDRIKELLTQKQVAASGALMESWIAGTEASTAKANDTLKRDSDFWDKALAGAKSDAAKQKEIDAVNAAAARDIQNAPNMKAEVEQKQRDALALIEKKYAAKVATPRPVANTGDAAASAAAAAAVDQQIQALIRVQAALDPTTKAWADYNAEVAKQDKIAATAKGVAGADVAAIDARRNAVVQAAAAARGADLAAIAKKDQQAWEQLRDSLRTPAEVKLDNAIAQIQELNALLEKGANINSPEYQAALKRIGENAVTPLPSYQGVDAAVGGPFSEMAKNFRAQQELETSYATQAAALEKQLDDGKLASHAAYLAAKGKLDTDYKNKSLVIEQSRQQLTLTTMSDFFGQVASLQHSQNSKMAAIGKAAAIAQAIINTYQSATAAYAALAGIPYVGPFLGAAAAAVAIAAGLANVQAIRAQPTSFDTGGYTGPGGRLQPAGIVHKGEVVWSQHDVARAGGVPVVEAMRLGRRGYAEGGIVAAPRLQAPVAPRARLQDPAANVSAGPTVANNFRFISAFDANELAQRILETPAGEKAVVNHVIANGTAVRQGIAA